MEYLVVDLTADVTPGDSAFRMMLRCWERFISPSADEGEHIVCRVGPKGIMHFAVTLRANDAAANRLAAMRAFLDQGEPC